MRYHHIQKSPLYLLLALVGASMLTAAFTIPEPVVQVSLASAGVAMAILSLSFRHLETRDEGDSLLVAFGPLPVFRRHVSYDNIESVTQSRSTLLDGWGIHLSPSGGWTWNLWGYDCVDIKMKKGSKLRLGTDDPTSLCEFLLRRANESASPALVK